MQHAEEINQLIRLAYRGSSYTNQGFRAFEQEKASKLTSLLKTNNLFFTTSVLGMRAVSHVIEEQALSLGNPFRLYTDFQKLSRFKPQQKCYQKIVALGQPVYIFGVPDASLNYPPNLQVVKLEEAQNLHQPSLANYWFVILNSPQSVSIALLARELPPLQRPRNAPDQLIFRNFEGLWTYDQAAISHLAAILDDFIVSVTPKIISAK